MSILLGIGRGTLNNIKMQEIASDIITLSSDDEFESPPKRIKINSDQNVTDSLKLLNSLKEISTVSEKHFEEKIKIKNQKEDNSITIIIKGDETVTTKVEKEKSNDISSNVVIIDEEPSDENLLDGGEQISIKTSPIVLDDSLEESEDPEDLKVTTQVHEDGDSDSKKNENNHPIDDRPSTSKASESHKLLDQLLETCATAIRGSKYEAKLHAKFPKMRKHFNNCENLHNEESFKKLLQENIKSAEFSAADAVVCFQKVFSFLLDNTLGTSIEVSEDVLPKIMKLEKTCKLIIKKLKQLEESELDFDDESDSTYMQIDRYSQRLNKVYNKYCQLLNKNPYAGRLIYDKVHFVSSNHIEINRAITKCCKHNKFPTYYDIEKCIKKCVSKNNLPLSEIEIKEESKKCFEMLGNLLQLKRKKELYESHCSFITLNEDPATKDPDLKERLQQSLDEGNKKMKDVIEKYVRMQENNVNPDLSEDSDDSHYQSSESESEN